MLLQDENDNAPIFEQDKYTFKIKENNDPGAILATLRATDADVGENGEVRYTIAGEDAEAFSIDEITIGFQGHHARLKMRCGKFKRAGDGFQVCAPRRGPAPIVSNARPV